MSNKNNTSNSKMAVPEAKEAMDKFKMEIANELDGKYGAKTAATLVREAAEVYEKRGRLKKF